MDRKILIDYLNFEINVENYLKQRDYLEKLLFWNQSTAAFMNFFIYFCLKP